MLPMSMVTPAPPRKTTCLLPTVVIGVVGVAPAKDIAAVSKYSVVFVPLGEGRYCNPLGLSSIVSIILSASTIETVWSHQSATPSMSFKKSSSNAINSSAEA